MTSSQKTLKLLHVQVYSNFFSLELLSQLTKKTLNQSQRKERFTISKDGRFPAPLDKTATLLTNTFKNQINTAILKRYVPGEPSEAFKIHKDPDEYKGRIFLCSLSGRAKLKVFSSDMKTNAEIVCLPNTVIVTPASILHQVSEPNEKYGTRCFLFFGYSNQVS